MSETTAAATTTEPRGAEFLDLLESKHNQVLTELDALNERIEKVLSVYASSRASGATTGDERASQPKAA